MRKSPLAPLVLALSAACAVRASLSTQAGEPLPEGAECQSLLGEPLRPPPIPDAERVTREAALEAARAAWEADRGDPARWIDVGRRTAHLNRFREALEWFERAAEEFPEDPRMQRHRGHRLITLRRFAEAREALERAAELAADWPDEVEPNLAPNASGAELEHFQPNIWYHLGLANYLLGDFDRAAEGFWRCYELAGNTDSRVSALHWLYSSLSRAGRMEEARAAVADVRADWPVQEYAGYHALTLVYNGRADADEVLARFRDAGGIEFATVGYGIGNYHFTRGDLERAGAIWREIVPEADWHAFGHIAAEVELART
jgi:tetratricopeptide (TPR) repeat protein